MVYDFIIASGNENLIDENMAACLYAGLVSDTGSFKFNCTTPAVHRMAARLMETGIDHSKYTAICLTIFWKTESGLSGMF